MLRKDLYGFMSSQGHWNRTVWNPGPEQITLASSVELDCYLFPSLSIVFLVCFVVITIRKKNKVTVNGSTKSYTPHSMQDTCFSVSVCLFRTVCVAVCRSLDLLMPPAKPLCLFSMNKARSVLGSCGFLECVYSEQTARGWWAVPWVESVYWIRIGNCMFKVISELMESYMAVSVDPLWSLIWSPSVFSYTFSFSFSPFSLWAHLSVPLLCELHKQLIHLL